METKKINTQELKLVEDLLPIVNSEAEYNSLMADKVRLCSYSKVMKGGVRKW